MAAAGAGKKSCCANTYEPVVSPDELSVALVYLLSNESSFILVSTIEIDGGHR